MHRIPKRLDQVWAIALLCLIAVTWRLWIPRGDALEIPMVDGLGGLPAVMRWLPLVVLTLVPAFMLVWNERRLWWLIAIALAAAFLMNQHRLQPWAYQTSIYATVFATLDRDQARKWLRPLAASIYLYSAAGKLDYQFSHTVGQQFLETVMNVGGGIPETWSETSRARATMLFPAGELIVGIGLLIPPTRALAGWLAILFHLSLLILLGPWGLDHSTGVLVWNVAMMAQAYFLFVALDEVSEEPKMRVSRGAKFAQAVVLIALVAPLGERAGYWDHWPSWALYSPHSSRVSVEVHETAQAKIGWELRLYLTETNRRDRWRTLATDRWSLRKLGVPVYPQARFQLAVADRLADQNDLDDAIRAIVRGTSDRFTGKRTEQRLIGAKKIREALEQYWLVGVR